MLNFLNLKPGARVVDYFSAGGYNTELLSYIVGPEGQVIAYNNAPYLKFAADKPAKRYDGNRLPNVIDTPLGRLDSRHREHLVDRYFPHASDQVLLLSTDEEIDAYLLGRLKKSVARTYTLVHDETDFTTNVVEGYWWGAGYQHVA